MQKNKGQSFQRIIKDYWGYCVVAVFLFVSILIVIVQREKLYIAVHDFLDATHVYLTMVKDQHLFFSSANEIQMLGGVDRNLLPVSEYKLYSWFYMILPPFWAMIVGWYSKILLSLTGFAVLERILIPDRKTTRNLTPLVGLAYGLFPCFIVESVSFSSLPLLLALLILLYRKPKKRYYLLLFLYPVLSSFVFFGIFICGYMLLFFILDWIRKRHPAFRMLIAIVPIALGYILTEWRLFYATFFPAGPSVRTGYAENMISLPEAAGQAFSVFWDATYHADSVHKWIVLPVCVVFLIYLNVQYIRKRTAKKILSDPVNWVFLWIVFNSLIYPVDQMEGFKRFIETVLPPLSGFTFSRTAWFNPFLWYFLFFMVLHRIGKPVLCSVLAFVSSVVVAIAPQMYNPVIYNIPGLYEAYARITGKEPHLTYGEFYSAGLFDKIKQDIGYQGEWSAAYGMHPSVLQYNDIATLDGYFTLYPLSYKEAFRGIIAPELAVDENHRSYFDDWGGRAYLFSTEIDYQPEYDLGADEADLLIDPESFRNLGGRYIFSRVAVRNADELGLQEIGCWSDAGSPYTIYVYQMAEKEY